MCVYTHIYIYFSIPTISAKTVLANMFGHYVELFTLYNWLK